MKSSIIHHFTPTSTNKKVQKEGSKLAEVKKGQEGWRRQEELEELEEQRG